MRFRFSEGVRANNDPSFGEINQLVKQFGLESEPVDASVYYRKLREAAFLGAIPKFDFIDMEQGREVETEKNIGLERI